VEQRFYRSLSFPQDFGDVLNLFLLEESQGNDLLVFSRERGDFFLNFQKIVVSS